MKIITPKYDLGDCLLIEGTELEIERVLTVNTIRVDVVYGYSPPDIKQSVWYSFKESKMMYEESAVIKKVGRK